MRLALLPLIVSSALVGVLPAGHDAPHVEPTPLRRVVVFENVVRNDSSCVLRDATCDLLLPEDGPGQHVRSLRLSAHDWTLARDAEGQWCASTVVPRLEPGASVTFGWRATVELAAGLAAADPRPPSEPEILRALADGPQLRLDDPAVRAAAAAVRAAAPGGDPDALVLAALDHVRESVRYELEGGWRPAPEVLAEGAGSCSESAFAFVAICRRLGVPARWIGGTVQRRGSGGSAVDSTFHRLAEVWLEERGWVRVETTAARGANEDPSGPGPLPRALLVLSRAGSEGGATGLYYHARNGWSAPRGSDARPHVTKRATWTVDRGTEAPADDVFAVDVPAGATGRYSSTSTNSPPLSSAISVR